ncbi:MAG: ribosomal L7Ae/L30e/S12e/Gadd45 family protein [Dethiobacteria bacterium]
MNYSIEDLKAAHKKVVGAKQTLKCIEKGEAKAVFIAEDAEERVVAPLINLCKEKEIAWGYAGSMIELGRACEIKVGAAAVVII